MNLDRSKFLCTQWMTSSRKSLKQDFVRNPRFWIDSHNFGTDLVWRKSFYLNFFLFSKYYICNVNILRTDNGQTADGYLFYYTFSGKLVQMLLDWIESTERIVSYLYQFGRYLSFIYEYLLKEVKSEDFVSNWVWRKKLFLILFCTKLNGY